MDLTPIEQAVMDRFADKSHSAGGPRAGYVLRRLAVARGLESGQDVDGGIAALIERGLIAASENGEFVFLTEAGADALAARGRSPVGRAATA